MDSSVSLDTEIESIDYSTPSFFFTYTGHVGESDSIFRYFGNTSYSTYNSGYLMFVPTFTSELMGNLPSDVDSVCQGNQACIYDYAISGNAELGNSTQSASMDGQELQAILSKTMINGIRAPILRNP